MGADLGSPLPYLLGGGGGGGGRAYGCMHTLEGGSGGGTSVAWHQDFVVVLPGQGAVDHPVALHLSLAVVPGELKADGCPRAHPQVLGGINLCDTRERGTISPLGSGNAPRSLGTPKRGWSRTRLPWLWGAIRGPSSPGRVLAEGAGVICSHLFLSMGWEIIES